MARHEVTLQQLPAALRRLNRTIALELARALRRGARAGRRIVVAATPKDTGELRDAWEVTEGGDTGAVAIIVNDAPHAGVVEMGTGPHPVPAEEREALRIWAARHFRRVQARDKWLRGPRRQKAIDNLVGKMVKKLETRGQKPTYFVLKSLERVAGEVLDEVLRALDDVSRKEQP